MPSLKNLTADNIRLRDLPALKEAHVGRHSEPCRHDKVGECPYCSECEGGK
jgi:hypothetical protein